MRHSTGDILRNDILLDVIAKSGVETYMSIRDNYRPDLSDEEQRKWLVRELYLCQHGTDAGALR